MRVTVWRIGMVPVVHLGLWQEGVRVHSGTDPPGETTLDPWLDDPFPDYDTEPVKAFSAT